MNLDKWIAIGIQAGKRNSWRDPKKLTNANVWRDSAYVTVCYTAFTQIGVQARLISFVIIPETRIGFNVTDFSLVNFDRTTCYLQHQSENAWEYYQAWKAVWCLVVCDLQLPTLKIIKSTISIKSKLVQKGSDQPWEQANRDQSIYIPQTMPWKLLWFLSLWQNP